MSRPADPRIDNHSPMALSIKQVCAVTGFSRTTIYDAIKSGALVARKNGRRTFVLQTDLEAWLRPRPAVRQLLQHGLKWLKATFCQDQP
jgi:excisionase family DNA binding protein